MSLGRRVISRQRLLAIGPLLRLEREHHVNVFHRHQRPCLPRVTGLSPSTPPTGLATRALALRRITRWRTRRGARVLLHALHQLLHGGLERRYAGFERQDRVLRVARCAVPDLRR
jgi:hypothetical protein